MMFKQPSKELASGMLLLIFLDALPISIGNKESVMLENLQVSYALKTFLPIYAMTLWPYNCTYFTVFYGIISKK